MDGRLSQSDVTLRGLAPTAVDSEGDRRSAEAQPQSAEADFVPFVARGLNRTCDLFSPTALPLLSGTLYLLMQFLRIPVVWLESERNAAMALRVRDTMSFQVGTREPVV